MIAASPMMAGYMRTAAESLMTDTCRIEVRSSVVGEMGDIYDDYLVQDASVKCRVITAGKRSSERPADDGGRRVVEDAYVLVVPYATVLLVGQRVTLSSGEQWYVVQTLTERTDGPDAQALIVREMP